MAPASILHSRPRSVLILARRPSAARSCSSIRSLPDHQPARADSASTARPLTPACSSPTRAQRGDRSSTTTLVPTFCRDGLAFRIDNARPGPSPPSSENSPNRHVMALRLRVGAAVSWSAVGPPSVRCCAACASAPPRPARSTPPRRPRRPHPVRRCAACLRGGARRPPCRSRPRVDVVVAGPTRPRTPCPSPPGRPPLHRRAVARVDAGELATTSSPPHPHARRSHRPEASASTSSSITENLDSGGGGDLFAKVSGLLMAARSAPARDAKLRAKAVIVDDRDVLLTGANMTNAPLTRTSSAPAQPRRRHRPTGPATLRAH